MGFETGAGAFMQAGSYSAAQMRRSVYAWAARTGANTPGLISGGLLSAQDLQLTAAVSGLVVYTSVGECLIPGSEGSNQGGYAAFLSSQNSTTLATANASNPRIDIICATVGDAAYALPSGGTSGAVTIQGVTGTPTPGATLGNLSGAPALPASSLLLGYVLVPATATSITNTDILNVATPVLVNGLSTIAGTVTTPARSLATAYQPNTARATFVSVQTTDSTGGGVAGATAYIGPTSSPATQAASSTASQATSFSTYMSLSFVVPAAWYYKVTNLANVSAITVTETTL